MHILPSMLALTLLGQKGEKREKTLPETLFLELLVAAKKSEWIMFFLSQPNLTLTHVGSDKVIGFHISSTFTGVEMHILPSMLALTLLGQKGEKKHDQNSWLTGP